LFDRLIEKHFASIYLLAKLLGQLLDDVAARDRAVQLFLLASLGLKSKRHLRHSLGQLASVGRLKDNPFLPGLALLFGLAHQTWPAQHRQSLGNEIIAAVAIRHSLYFTGFSHTGHILNQQNFHSSTCASLSPVSAGRDISCTNNLTARIILPNPTRGKLKVLFDLDVILDLLQRREPFYAASARVLACAETGTVEGWVAAQGLTTLFYLLTKYQSVEQARVTLSELLNFLSVATVDRAVIEGTLNLPYQDFEDAVQMVAAVRSGAQYLVTRNVQDFRSGPLPVLQPAELLALV